MENVVVVDIDGTLTKVGDRELCLKKTPPDWDEFYARCGEDKPVPEVIEMVNSLATQYVIILCTGRRESCRKATELWLEENGLFDFGLMLMRPDGDFRHDTILKPDLLQRAGISLSQILLTVEDRTSMVKKWRELGLVCLQPAEGDF